MCRQGRCFHATGLRTSLGGPAGGIGVEYSLGDQMHEEEALTLPADRAARGTVHGIRKNVIARCYVAEGSN